MVTGRLQVVWLLLGSTRCCFADTPELEETHYAQLFKTYLDSIPLVKQSALRFSCARISGNDSLLRDSAKRATFTRDVTIEWDEQSLLNFDREGGPLQIKSFETNIGIKEDALRVHLWSKSISSNLLPMQIDLGERKSPTMGWILARTRRRARACLHRARLSIC